MFNGDPYVIGKNPGLTDAQRAKVKLDAEWAAAGKPTLEERIERRNQRIANSIQRAFDKK